MNKEKIKAEKKQGAFSPDPATLHTTDPQEHMKCPVSSVAQLIKETAEENDTVSKSEADAKKEKNS